jgi:polygalacturonase
MSRFFSNAVSIVFFLYPLFSIAQVAEIDNYPISTFHSLSTDYQLSANGKGIDIVKAEDYDYAHFSMRNGRCDFEITVLNATAVEGASISPLKLGIVHQVNDNKITFSIPNDEYLIVSVKNKGRKLIIAADPWETNKPAASGKGIFNIRQPPFNADATGATLMTTAIQSAVDSASAYGTENKTKGIVYVPAGLYKMGNLKLRSNIALYLEKGSLIRFSDDPSDYRVDFHKSSFPMDGTWFISTVENANNILIYGRGTIDGNGKYMQKTKKFLNHILVPVGCSNFTFDGPIIKSSACWGVVVARSNDVLFTNYKHFNCHSIGEDDCIDVNESQNVLVKHAIASALDDPFSTKSWSGVGISAKWYGSPEKCSNVTFDDCFGWTMCVGFKVGQGMGQLQENITFKNGVVYDCARGLAIEHKWGINEARNITFENIDIERVGNNCEGPQWLQLFIKGGDGLGGGPVNNVVFRNITVRDKGKRISELKGSNPSAAVRGVTFENIYMLGNSTPATSLDEMNITDINNYISDIKILPKTGSPKRIQAEYYNLNNSVQLGVCDDVDKGTHVSTKDGLTMLYYNVDFGKGTTAIDVRLATENEGGTIEFRLGSAIGSVLGTLNVSSTGGWKTYKTVTVPIKNTKGIQTLAMVFKKSDALTIGNLNWIELKRKD